MYHVPGTGITILILYLISYLFSSLGYFTLSQHKKFWNSILAITFITSAISGLFMALQISYKWDIPYVKTILKWHVEFGIGLAATGLLHLIWHFPYYRKLFSEENKKVIVLPDNSDINAGGSVAGSNLFVTGFVSSSIQLLLLRELMNISGGYELISGIFLGTWLFVSAAGAFFAGKSRITDFGKLNLVFALSPVISLILMFLLARIFMEKGETPSVLISIIYTLLVLIPFCISSGFIFIKLIVAAKKTYGYNPGKSFSIETSGGIIAGILVTLLISEDIGTYKLLIVILLLSLAYTLLTYYLSGRIARLALKFLVILTVTLIVITDPDIFFRQLMLPGINVTKSTDTPYGNITTGSYNNEKSVYYNQRLIKHNDDVIEREEDIHYAILQHNAPQSIMIISGSFESRVQEILKYPVEKILFIERDPALSSMIKADSLNKRVTVSNKDAFSYLKKTHEKSDVIIMLVPPPSTLLLNRFYTKEFFESISKLLNEGGVFMCSPGSGENYYNEESIKMNSSIFNTLQAVFSFVSPIVGNKLYFIASDNPLSTEFCKLSTTKGISNLYVSSNYLSDDLTERKTQEIKSLMNPSIKINSSYFPLAYSYFQTYHLSRYTNEKSILFILFVILFASSFITVIRKNMTMYFCALSLAGFEIISLLTLQMTIGNMYQMTGLIIAAIMSGLAVGSGFSFRITSGISILMKGVILTCFYFFTGLFYHKFFQTENSNTSILLILFFAFIPACLTGSIFRELTIDDDKKNNLIRVYSADLTGSAIGFIAIAGFVIPIFGTVITIYFLGALVFTGIFFGTILNKH